MDHTNVELKLDITTATGILPELPVTSIRLDSCE
jgi:hypothetical protein